MWILKEGILIGMLYLHSCGITNYGAFYTGFAEILIDNTTSNNLHLKFTRYRFCFNKKGDRNNVR